MTSSRLVEDSMYFDQDTLVLHDARSKQWLKFEQPHEVIFTHSENDVYESIRHIEERILQTGRYAAGFVAYEAAPGFDPAFRVRDPDGFPLVWFGLYNQAKPFQLTPAKNLSKEPQWVPSINKADYQETIFRIKRYIQYGDTYQVNYSFRLLAEPVQDPWQLFLQMNQSQGGRYGAYIQLKDWTICSATPELFFYRNGDHLISRPMKGTRPRGRWPEEDQNHAHELRQSFKDRAENTMIVDVVRNDMSHVAHPGSVHATQLFDIEQYHTVWQMTSSVECRTTATLANIFKAMFPPASITGAPKIRTTEIIAELETRPRRIYTGSIGFITPGGSAQFNIAIRTVLIDHRSNQMEYGVGGGIVWDSVDQAEFEECATKARILSSPRPPFQLLETLLWTDRDGFVLLNEHLDRQANSAAYFGWQYNRNLVHTRLIAFSKTFQSGLPQGIRLLVGQNGDITLEHTPLDPEKLTPPPGQWQVILAPSPIDCNDVFLYHKTTQRRVYENARQTKSGYNDVLLYNDTGQLTESTIANIAIRRDRQLITPPISCGLLNGTRRAAMLQRGELTEGIITIEELKEGDEIYLLNSVRGIWKAVYRFNTI